MQVQPGIACAKDATLKRKEKRRRHGKPLPTMIKEMKGKPTEHCVPHSLCRQAAEEAKAERLRQMQERLAAYQQQTQAAQGE